MNIIIMNVVDFTKLDKKYWTKYSYLGDWTDDTSLVRVVLNIPELLNDGKIS